MVPWSGGTLRSRLTHAQTATVPTTTPTPSPQNHDMRSMIAEVEFHSQKMVSGELRPGFDVVYLAVSRSKDAVRVIRDGVSGWDNAMLN